MSYLLFLDESGHDHKTMPYEVHGGIALHASRVWPFVQGMRALEQEAFGVPLHEYQAELKGAHLLGKKRYQWAAQEEMPLPDITRREQAQAFLRKGLAKQPPSRSEFTAYGQACLKMAHSMMTLLQRQNAILLAVAVPRGVQKPPESHNPEDLRRDWVYLMNRYSLFLREKQEQGLLVMDHIENSEDRRFMQRLERYFSLTQNGRGYAQHIIPTPLFVLSDMTYAIQAADLCIYCLNWGFRLPERGMDAPTRPEITQDFEAALSALQWRGVVEKEGREYPRFSVCYLPQLYGETGKRKEGNAP